MCETTNVSLETFLRKTMADKVESSMHAANTEVTQTHCFSLKRSVLVKPKNKQTNKIKLTEGHREVTLVTFS